MIVSLTPTLSIVFFVEVRIFVCSATAEGALQVIKWRCDSSFLHWKGQVDSNLLSSSISCCCTSDRLLISNCRCLLSANFLFAYLHFVSHESFGVVLLVYTLIVSQGIPLTPPIVSFERIFPQLCFCMRYVCTSCPLVICLMCLDISFISALNCLVLQCLLSCTLGPCFGHQPDF